MARHSPCQAIDSERIAWIVKMKEQGAKNAEIASVQKVSVRRVQQLYSRYRKNGELPIFGRAGRPTKPRLPLKIVYDCNA